VQQILEQHPGAKIEVFAVWEPMLATDWQSPVGGVLARLKDSRARQYWDPRHLLAQRLAADARDPQPKQACCVRDNILWDLAALYPPGAEWKDALPPAVFFNGPVVKRQPELETALNLLGLPERNSAPAASRQ
jgi:hypothetical protein